MTLYYTTSAGYEEAQLEVASSLGGYRSSTTVINNDFDNIFGEISIYTIREARDEYIAVILRNTTGSDATGVEAWFESPDTPQGTMQIAAVRTTTDAEGDPIMERVRTKFTQPFTGNFVTTSASNRLSIGNVADDEEIGIWFKRSISRTNIDSVSDVYERDPDNPNLYREITRDKEETHLFKVDYTI